MPIELVNIGGAANDGTGDPLRDAFAKVNDNVLDLVARTGPAYDNGVIPAGLLTFDTAGARAGCLYATLGGNVTINPLNIPLARVSIYTLYLTQDATGGRVVSYPPNTTIFNGGTGQVNPAANSATVITLITANGGSNWIATTIDARPTELEPYKFTVEADGTFHVTSDQAESLHLGGVLKRGTGTLAFAKSLSATPTTFTSVSGTTSFAVGDTLRITVTGFSGWLTISIPRTAQ